MCMGRREAASRFRGEQERCWSSVVQYDRLTLAVFENGLRDRNNPICTLSQHGYCDQRAKARKYTCLVTLNKIAALHVHGAKRTRFRVYGRSRRALVVRDARCPSAIHGMVPETKGEDFLKLLVAAAFPGNPAIWIPFGEHPNDFLGGPPTPILTVLHAYAQKLFFNKPHVESCLLGLHDLELSRRNTVRGDRP